MFEGNDDQDLFQETTRRFLESEAPLSAARSLAGTKSGFEAPYWRRGSELGWTSLAVPEQAGGGSVSGQGVVDLLLLAYEFGRHAAPGPLGPVNLVAAALGRWGSDEQKSGPLAELLEGSKTAAWAIAEPAPNDALGVVEMVGRIDGPTVVLDGVKTPVEAGAEADYLLVTVRDTAPSDSRALTQVLVPSDTPGVTLTPLRGIDLTRRYASASFEDVRLPLSSLVGAAGTASPAAGWLTDLAVVIQLAETVGAMHWAFDTTLEWAFNRYSFGRPLASYQEIKHRFADMKTWLEASAAIAQSAAEAVEVDGEDRSEVVSAAKAYIGQHAPELMQDCIQLHGGIGVTFDHDLHLFLRRVATNLPMYGSPAEHAIRVARILETQEATHG